MKYCVIRIADGQEMYKGDSEGAAAYWLRPGRVYGKGKRPNDALQEAQRRLADQRGAPVHQQTTEGNGHEPL